MLLKASKKSNRLNEQKIILFTASSATDKEIDVLLQYDGITSCVRKPVDIDVLIEQIEQVAKS